MGDCGYFAERFAQEIGGKVIGIGADAYEGYRDDEGDVYTNPAHYLVQHGSKYIDVTGVFRSLKSVLDYYTAFYKFALPDIANKLNMRLWTEPKKGDRECGVDTKRDADEAVRTLLTYTAPKEIFSPRGEYSTRFVIPYPISNDEFCRAVKIVLDAEIFQDQDNIAFARIGNVYLDAGGIFRAGYVFHGCRSMELHGSPDDAVWAVASIQRELFFGDNAFLNEWYYRPMFPLESIAYLYLPDFMLAEAKYPFKGAMMEAPFSDDVKAYLEEGDLYSAIGDTWATRIMCIRAECMSTTSAL